MKSIRPGKQRKELFNAPLHKKRKWIASHLEENLLLKYDRRSIPVVKGDTVKVMRGSFKGHEDKIAHVNIKKRYVEIEGLTTTKADGKKIARPLHASNLLITKLNLTDKWRRNKLEKGLSEEAKKEIEKEAEQQLKQAEEEQKIKVEEEKEKAKEEAATDETVEPVVEKTEETTEPKPEEKSATETKKPKVKVEKKAVEKKKTPAKKTPTKTKKKKEEEK
ncbi:MAG: 50S ribosomal protein L24 [Euryarchaeota archaeon]|nr:50S ribosomal protein L24 [Euryarchaeota archaeon]